MNVLHSRRLKERAASMLQPEYRKLVTLHGAVSFGVVLVISLIQLLLSLAMTNESGLDGMGTSAVFSTAKASLGLISGIVLPFWQIGVLHTAIRVTRRQDAEFSHLTRGLQRWGVVLRYYLLLIVLYVGAVMLLSNLIPVLMIFVPIPQALEEAMLSLMSQNITDPMEMIAALPKEQMLAFVLPVSAVFMVIFGAVILHLSYRFRMSQYLLMDDPAMPALPSLLVSNQMTKGHKWSLLKLDISFWWYYLLQAAASALSYGPEILEFAGITLPMSANMAFFLFQALYCAAGMIVVWLFGAYVQTTYACAYDELRTPPQDQTIITV